MGHLLSSVNPEASASIQPKPERQALPDVGEIVIYHMRQGYARNGKTRFPALVQAHGDRNTLALTVVVDAGDMMDESLVDEIGIGREFHVWERPTRNFHGQDDIKALTELMQDINARLQLVEEENDELRTLVAPKGKGK